MAVVDPLKLLLKWFRLGGVLARRHLAEGGLQIAEHFDHTGVVRAMERGQLVEEVVSPLNARMAEYLSAGHHLKGDATEAMGHANAEVAWVFAAALTP